MKARLRTSIAALLCFAAGSAALAQAVPANKAEPQNGVVGPTQLQNFSLGGTPTRQSPPQAQQPPAVAPKPRTAAPPPAPVAATAQKPGEAPPKASRQTERASPSTPAGGAVAAPGPVSSTHLDEGPREPLPAAPVVAKAAPSSNVAFLPWLLAALALAGAAAWLFLRRRQRESVAGTPALDLFEAPATTEATAPPPPAPQPRSEPVPAGVVSTRLRPWLEIELKPDRGVVDDEKTAVAFELSVYNSGSLPARDVLLEATLFGAGPTQDKQIELFFDNPIGKGDPIALIGPMQRVSVNTVVFLARDQVRPIEIEGRALFVPVIAVNALYSWSGKKAQTSASYFVGKQTSGEKLSPFRLDVGRRIYRGLAAREHELKLRK